MMRSTSAVAACCSRASLSSRSACVSRARRRSISPRSASTTRPSSVRALWSPAKGTSGAVLGGAVSHYEQVVTLPIPDKLPLPLTVHRHQGEPCPRCGTTIEAVHYEDYVMCYCPTDQTGGKVLKDRRLSRLLK